MADIKARINETVDRHSWTVRLEHWIIAISGFLLVFSGFGQFPLYRRYMLDKLPALGWASNFALQLKIHYAAAIVFTAAVFFHLVYHLMKREFSLWPRKGDVGESWQIIKATFGKGEEPPCGKYLAEQRLAYIFFGGTILLLVVTGLVKTAKNLPGVDLSPAMTTAVAMLHNLGTVLFLGSLATHVLALFLKPNRPLLAGIFTGRVRADYACHRHPLWEEAGLAAVQQTAEPADGTPGQIVEETAAETVVEEPVSGIETDPPGEQEEPEEDEMASCANWSGRYS